MSSGTSARRSRGLARPSGSGSGRATPASASAQQMLRTPPDILITTPESLFLLLTSQARETLRSVETLILDEVHAVAGTKRGAHLMISVERLQALVERPLQRIGLSATQRPLEEIGRFVAGHRPPDLARRRGDAKGSRPRGRDPGGRPSRARGRARPRPAGDARRRRDGERVRVDRAFDLAVGLPGTARARPGPPVDHRLRQQPAPRRTTCDPAERARRRGASPGPTTGRSPASSASRSRSCSRPERSRASWRPRASSSGSTWGPSTS